MIFFTFFLFFWQSIIYLNSSCALRFTKICSVIIHISQLVYFSVNVCGTSFNGSVSDVLIARWVIACECEHTCAISGLLLLGKLLKHHVYFFSHLHDNKYGVKWFKAMSYQFYPWFILSMKSWIISVCMYLLILCLWTNIRRPFTPSLSLK